MSLPMNLRFSLSILALTAASCGISDSQWEKVRIQLAEVKKSDQRYRPQMDSVGRIEGWGSKAVETLWEKQKAIDSTNLIAVDRIITKCGYPPKSKVGELSDIPFVVIQHADDSTLITYYEVIVGAGKNGDLKMKDVAQFQDRALMMQKLPQEYGTQVWIDFKEDKITGKRYDSLYLWKVRDFAHVDKKRSSVGLDSLDKHLGRYGIDPAKGYLIRR